MTEQLETSFTLIDGLRRVGPLGERDERAWTRFVDHYCPIVHRLARKKKLSREEAELIGQEFSVQMLRAMPKFEYDPQRGRFRDFVMTVALNLIRRHWRRIKQDREKRMKFGEQVLPEDLVEPAFDESSWWGGAERMRSLQRALPKVLSDSNSRDRNLFERIVLRNEPVSEVVAANGVSANTWYGIKYRMLDRLRKHAELMEKEWQ